LGGILRIIGVKVGLKDKFITEINGKCNDIISADENK
jgi:hypothetical protein